MNKCPNCGKILEIEIVPDYLNGTHIHYSCSCGYDSDKFKTEYSNQTEPGQS